MIKTITFKQKRKTMEYIRIQNRSMNTWLDEYYHLDTDRNVNRKR